MEKSIYGKDLREQLQASARDKMHRFLLCDGAFRGAILEGTKLVNEMRRSHELGILETLILGHSYIGTLLMSSNLKGEDRIVLGITCDGPAGGVSVEANAYGEVRGYLNVSSIPLDEPLDSFDLSPFFGGGILTVTKMSPKAKHPFTGQISLEHGNIAQDLANFSTRSEQIPSAYSVSIYFDAAGEVVGAGGLLVQALPGAVEDDLFKLEQIINWLPSIGNEVAKGRTVDSLLLEEFKEFEPDLLDARRVEFMCHCNRDRFARFLHQLPEDELDDIADKGPFPVVLTCHNCNTNYLFNTLEFDEVRRNASSRRSN